MKKEANLKYYWIVYLTTNLLNKFIYIGVHKTPNPDKYDGYLGCGVYSNKYKTYKHPKTKFQYAVKEFGPKNFIRKTIAVFEDAKSAYLLEGRLVNDQFLSRLDVYNMIRGGIIGPDGHPVQCYCYDVEGNFVAEYVSLKAAGYAVGYTPEGIRYAINNFTFSGNYYWTDNYYEVLDLTKFKPAFETKSVVTKDFDQNLTWKKMTVFQYSNDGNFEREYKTMTLAAKANGVTASSISRGIKLGYLVNNKYFSTEHFDHFSVARFETISKRTIYQYALDGTFIKEYKNVNQAKLELGLKSDIGASIKKGGTCGGFQWTIEKVEKMPDLTKKNRTGIAKKVAVYDLKGNLVETFNTVTECQKKYSSCKHVLHGKREVGNGHKFKYID